MSFSKWIFCASLTTTKVSAIPESSLVPLCRPLGQKLGNPWCAVCHHRFAYLGTSSVLFLPSEVHPCCCVCQQCAPLYCWVAAPPVDGPWSLFTWRQTFSSSPSCLPLGDQCWVGLYSEMVLPKICCADSNEAGLPRWIGSGNCCFLAQGEESKG